MTDPRTPNINLNGASIINPAPGDRLVFVVDSIPFEAEDGKTWAEQMVRELSSLFPAQKVSLVAGIHTVIHEKGSNDES